jgi:DNA-binding FadR family transcriptional regulator
MSSVGDESDQVQLCERHRSLIDAVASQDPERAGLEMRRHIEHIAELLRDAGTEEEAE